MPTGSWLFSGVFAATALYALTRIVFRTAGCSRLNDVSHLLMSLAMAAMTQRWTPGAPLVLGVGQIVLFALVAVGFAYRLRIRGDRSAAPHLVMNATMVWMTVGMALPTAGSAGHGHHAGSAPFTALWVDAVTLLTVGCVAGSTCRVVVPGSARATSGEVAVRAESTCQMIMGVGMAGMLLTML